MAQVSDSGQGDAGHDHGHRGVFAGVFGEGHPNAKRDESRFRYLPGFAILFIVYVLGYLIIYLFGWNPRAPFIDAGPYKLSWAELVLFLAALTAIAEQLRISHAGVDNTVLCLAMAGVAVFQLLLIAVSGSHWFNMLTGDSNVFLTTEFMMQTILNFVQVAVAFVINTRTASRSIVSERG